MAEFECKQRDINLLTEVESAINHFVDNAMSAKIQQGLMGVTRYIRLQKNKLSLQNKR